MCVRGDHQGAVFSVYTHTHSHSPWGVFKSLIILPLLGGNWSTQSKSTGRPGQESHHTPPPPSKSIHPRPLANVHVCGNTSSIKTDVGDAGTSTEAPLHPDARHHQAHVPKRSLVRVAVEGQGSTSGTAPGWAPLRLTWRALKTLQERYVHVCL